MVPAAVSISGSTHRVEPGQSVAFAGVVTSEDGTPVRRARVTLQTLSDGPLGPGQLRPHRRLRPGDARAAADLDHAPPYACAPPACTAPAGGSPCTPSSTVTSARGSTAGTVVITATAVGAQPGDRVQLLTKAGEVAAGTLDGSSISFTVTPTKKKTRYTVLLPGTSAHGPDRASITVIVKNPGGSGRGSLPARR